MKLRVRFNIDKYLIQIEDNVKTINELKTAISVEIRGLPENYSLSLDGISALDEEEENGLISDAGVVSGDLIHIISPSAGNVMSPPVKSTPVINTMNQQAVTEHEVPTASSNIAELSTLMDVDREEGNILSLKAIPSNALKTDDEEFLLGQSVELVTSKFKRLPPSQERSLAIVVHSLMIELGFKLIDKDLLVKTEDDDDDDDVGAIRMAFGHPAFSKMTFHLFLVTMMSKSILHGSSKEEGEVVQKDSLKIDPETIIRKSSDHNLVLKNLRRDQLIILRKQFRDQIGNRMMQSALRAHGFREMAELSTLPFEVQLKVLDLLDVPSLFRLSETSKFWRSQCLEPFIWKRKYYQLARKQGCVQTAPSHASSSDWLELYKEVYKANKMRSKQDRFLPYRFPPPNFRQHIYPFVPLNPFPGILGGYHDLVPGGPGIGTGIHFPPFHPSSFDPPSDNRPGSPPRGRRGGRSIFPPPGPGGMDWF